MKKPELKIKMWIVAREVLAVDVVEAANKTGRIYSITEAAKEFQPENKKPIGFK